MKSKVVFLLIAVFISTNFSCSTTAEMTALSKNSKPQFRYIYGEEDDKDASYAFQTPPEGKIFAEDCIGCKEEVGNVHAFKENVSVEQTKYLFKSNSENFEVIEKSDKTNDKGNKIGERVVSVSKYNGKVVVSRIFWTEGDVFWAVQAPTVELAKAFEQSEIFHCVREKKTFELINKYCISE